MRLVTTMTAAVFLLLFAYAGTARCADAVPVVHVYTWVNYFSPDAIRMFEEKYGCSVEFEYYDSNETMLEALSHGGGYEIVTPISSAVPALVEMNVIRRLDHDLLPNLRHINPESVVLYDDPDMRHGVPYTVSITGVGYDRRQFPGDPPKSWDLFADARLAGKVAMLNDPREALGAALLFLGFSLNSVNPDEIRAAGETLSGWKRNIDKFGVDDAVDGLETGRYAAVQAYNGDMAQVMRDNPDLGFFIPGEGGAISADNLAVCSDAENPELAHAFINHFLDPEIAVLNMNDILYYMPNQGADRERERFVEQNPAFAVDDETLEKCQVLLYLPDGRELYDETWLDVLIGE